jgi:hypothetical protein
MFIMLVIIGSKSMYVKQKIITILIGMVMIYLALDLRILDCGECTKPFAGLSKESPFHRISSGQIRPYCSEGGVTLLHRNLHRN